MIRTATRPTSKTTHLLRAAIYTRISRDDRAEEKEKRLGVQRQEKELRAEAERRGACVVAILEDNDLSGSGKVERPAFNRLIEMIERGEVDLVLSRDLDRLSRGFSPYVRFYEACAKAKITVGWMGGSADFRTGKGLLELDVRASFAREELRVIRSRIASKHLQLAEQGQDVGGGRAFGYEDDRRTIRPAEAALIRDAADKVLQGASLRSIATDWTRRGVVSVTGKTRWSVHVIKRILVSARISGRRERIWIDGDRRSIGMIVNDKAAWPAIITTEKSDALRGLLGSPDRRRNGKAGSYLLTHGIAVCGVCGADLVARPRGDGKRCMVCATGPGFKGCGKIRTLAEPVEDRVTEAVLRSIDQGALVRVMRRKDDAKDSAALRDVEDRMKDLACQWARGEISAAERGAARQVLVARQQGITARLDGSRRSQGLDGLPVDEEMRKRWPRLEIYRQRAIVSALVERVVIDPIRKPGRNTFDGRRVRIIWRA